MMRFVYLLLFLLFLYIEWIFVRDFVWGLPSILAMFANVGLVYVFIRNLKSSFKDKMKKDKSFMKNMFAFMFVITIAVIVHFILIRGVAIDMYGFDVARDVRQVQQVVETGQIYILFENFSKEPLYYHLAALTTTIVPDEFVALQATAALFGVLATIAVYILLKEISQRWFVAASGAILFSFSSWQLLMERLAYRAALVPFILLLLCYAFYIALRKRSVLAYYAIGLLTGIGFYIYTTFWIVPGVIALYLIYIFFKDADKKQLATCFAAGFIGFVTIITPLVSFVAQNPNVFFQRVEKRGLETAHLTQQERIKSFTTNYKQSLLGMVHQGTAFPPYENTSPYQKGLDSAVIVLAFVGVIAGLYRRHALTPLLLGFIFLTPIPSSMMSIGFESETPNFSRLITAMPAVYIFAAIGIWFFFERFEKNMKPVVMSLIAMLVIASGLIHIQRMTRDFAQSYPYQNIPIYSLTQQLVETSDVPIVSLLYLDPEVLPLYVENYQSRVLFPQSIAVADHGNEDPGFAATIEPSILPEIILIHRAGSMLYETISGYSCKQISTYYAQHSSFGLFVKRCFLSDNT